MTSVRTFTTLAGVLVLGACAAAPPSGPRVLVVPGPGKSFEQFQADDAGCRQYASGQTGYGPQQQQASSQAAVGTAVIGTGLGAAAGALIGSAAGHAGTGAAIGAGSGLLLGSAVAGNNAQASSAELQRRYDAAYVQCMVGHGESPAPRPTPVVAYPPPAYYAPPPGYYAPPPGYYAPPPGYPSY